MKHCENCGATLDPNEICDCTAPETAITPAVPQTPDRLIVVRQLPAIEQHLEQVRPEIEKKTAAAMALACSPETLQSVKATRAELNKEFGTWEEQRKQVKAAIDAPYDQFKAVYDTNIKDAYTKADADLAKKIADTESGIKQACADRLKAHFDDLCKAHGIDFLSFAQAGVRVDMTTARQKTPKKALDAITAFVEGVSRDVATITDMDGAAEIMAEYRRCLNLGTAVGTVTARRRAITEDQARIAAQRAAAQERRAAEHAVMQAAPELAAITPAPTVESEKMTAKFAVVGTREQLRNLVQFLKAGGYHYYDLK